jgi:hypothetical protein
MSSAKRDIQVYDMEKGVIKLQDSARNNMPFLAFRFHGNRLVALTAESLYIWKDLEAEQGLLCLQSGLFAIYVSF